MEAIEKIIKQPDKHTFCSRTLVKIIIIVIAAAAYVLFLQSEQGWRIALTGLTAMAIGCVFFRSKFGFSYTWRVTITQRNMLGMQAQMLWILLTLTPFFILTSIEFDGQMYAVANVRPLTLAIVIGAILFGIGMQLSGACTSGSIVGMGQGNSVPLFGIVGFITGALFAAYHSTYWQSLPALPSFSFFQSWGWGGLLAMILIVVAMFIICKKLHVPPAEPETKKKPSLMRAAVYLALLTTLLLALSGQPWGIVNGFTVMGGKLLLWWGYEDIDFWDFWTRYNAASEVLYNDSFSQTQIITNVGMLIGVVLASYYASQFRFSIPAPKMVVLSLVGGLLMGYGAQISYGCNIGSYMSALSSGSMHGWLWFIFALFGTGIGVIIRKRIGID